MKVAIYSRVSTDDKDQAPENQLRDLRSWCAANGHEVYDEYVDHETGTKGTAKRKRFAALFEDAYRRKFDMVVFWALDRFSREGMMPCIEHLQRLNGYGVVFHSYTEPHLNTDNEIVRNILLALLSSLAKVESEKISARVKAGMARVAASGKPWVSKKGRLVSNVGRPKLDVLLRRQIADRLAAGATPYRVAADLGISQHTVSKYAPQP